MAMNSQLPAVSGRWSERLSGLGIAIREPSLFPDSLKNQVYNVSESKRKND